MRFFRLWLLALALSIAAFGQATVVVMNIEGDGHGKVNVATIFPRLLAMGNCAKAKPSAKLLPEWKPVFRSFTQGQLCRSVMEMNFTNLSMLGDQLKAVSFPPALSMSLTQSGNEFTIDVQKGAKTGAGRHPVLPIEVMAMQIGVQVSVPEIVEVKGGGSFTPRPNPRTVQMQFPMKGAFDVAVVARLVNVPALPTPRSSASSKGGPVRGSLPGWVMPLLVTLALGVLAALAYFLWPIIADILGFGAAEGVAEETPVTETTGQQLPQELAKLHPPARTLLENEDVLLNEGQGLQSRMSGTFNQVATGPYGNPSTKYLWTIDNRGVNIALEETPFPTPRGNIVHTNLSSEASIGGEAWFTSENEVTINAGSGRFGAGSGATQAQWQAAVRFWEGLGYKVRAVPFGER